MKNLSKLFLIFTLLLTFTSAFAQEEGQGITRHHFVIPVGTPNDTLLIEKSDMLYEYWVIWQGDTLTKAWSYSPVSEIVSSLGIYGYNRSFLIQAYHGDGCPVAYQVLAIKDDGKAFISEYFGNCNEIGEMKMAWPMIQFVFQGDKETKRKAVSYLFNSQEGSLKEK